MCVPCALCIPVAPLGRRGPTSGYRGEWARPHAAAVHKLSSPIGRQASEQETPIGKSSVGNGASVFQNETHTDTQTPAAGHNFAHTHTRHCSPQHGNRGQCRAGSDRWSEPIAEAAAAAAAATSAAAICGECLREMCHAVGRNLY